MKLVVGLALLPVGFVVLSLASFWLAVRPPRIAVGLTPADYGLRAEGVEVRADDDLALSAWLIPRAGAPAVILLHGYPADKADMIPLAAALSADFTTLLLDLRYFGQSQGRATTLGFRERQDLRRAIDLLAARGHAGVGVFGFSLGGAIALVAAAEDSRIRAVAAYAAFADLRALGHELYWWMGPLRYPFVAMLRFWGRLVFGHDITRPSPEGAAAGLTVPVLLIHSRQDEQIPFAHAERLQRALARNRSLEVAVLARGRHGELPPDFGARLTRFFRLHVR